MDPVRDKERKPSGERAPLRGSVKSYIIGDTKCRGGGKRVEAECTLFLNLFRPAGSSLVAERKGCGKGLDIALWTAREPK